MTLRPILHGSLALALMLASTGALADHSELNPNVTEVKPGDTVTISRLPEDIYLRVQNDPDDLIWDRLPMYRTELFAAPPVHRSVQLRFDDGASHGKHLYFQVARSSERFYIRLHWKDASENRATTVDDFRDGVAVQYALGDADTSYMMGSGPDAPVNIWYWRADHEQRIENLAAGGYGSTTRLPEQNVSGASDYIQEAIPQDSEWHVVMSRPLAAGGEHQVTFDRDRVPMAFALWEGSDSERDGDKRVTHTWILLDTAAGDAAGGDTES
ncbi:ethylbenzene dehydrogenase-related protein [Halomonas icarae]|uniref:Dimethylsulfide dehydrogenase n=1 Tax=Halomonas icarae TaxID=2691040 RepID=A0A7X4VYB4_9GAMM|nr:ethylbenzene dehydrogenase-related protein [Halomonas icarae]MDR5902009.1 dimethylsulfide dehydrogenase [Halomonas icarae]NAW12290.1 dimethylsulfide dehydrogenase [Halomonas icarae]